MSRLILLVGLLGCAAAQAAGEPRALFGHQGVVRAVAFSPDGKLLASSGFDKTIRLWDAATGKELRSISGHQAVASSLSFSPDGGLLASGSMDSYVKVWSVADGKELKAVPASEEVLAVAFSPDGKLLGFAERSGRVKLVDTASWEEVRKLSGRALAFTPDGRFVVTSGKESAIQLTALIKGAKDRTVKTGSHAPYAVLSPDGKLAASRGASEKEVFLWDLTKGKAAGKLEGHSKRVSSLAFGPGGATLASASEDGTLRLWDLGKRKQLEALPLERVGFIAYSPDGKQLAAADGNLVKVWQLGE